jgi:hypothetical protein
LLDKRSIPPDVFERLESGFQGNLKFAGEIFSRARVGTTNGFVDDRGSDAPALEKHLPIV